eukprot:6175186-Pleurochrysis_carterae.AAC.1
MMMMLLLLLLLLLVVAMQPPPSSWSAFACGRKLTRSATRIVISYEAEMINLDKKTLSELRQRDCVRQEAAAQQEGAAAAAEEARLVREQHQAGADRRQRQVQGAFDQAAGGANASNDKVTRMDAHIAEL